MIMYKVLIVDDEKIIRIALKSMIHWEDEGFSADYVAEDGIIALEIVKKYHPDLIIVDIMMPNMDGIEFVKTVRNEGYAGEILILSNHQDFKYAVEALRHRVSDYIMKTDITPQSLSQCLANNKRRLDESAPLHNLKTPTSSTGEDIDILQNSLSAPNTVTDHPLSEPYLFLNVFVKSKFMKINPKSDIPNNALKNLAIEYVKHLGYFVLQFTANSILIVIPQKAMEGDSAIISTSIDKLQGLIQLYLNTECGFILSNTFYSTKQFLEMVLTLPESERLVLYYDFGNMIKVNESHSYINKTIDPNPIIQQIKQYIDHKDYNGCKAAFGNIALKLKEEKLHPQQTIRIMKKVFEFTSLHNTIRLAPVKNIMDEITQQFYNSCTLQEYIKNYNKLIDLLPSRILKASHSSCRKEIVLINEFIQKNIHKKITLGMLASSVNMSKNYISRLFKAETDTNIVNYINQLKLDHAKLLLETPGIPICDIASSLGFDETPYFNKLFHKFYGFSPTEYRKLYLDKITA